MITQEVMPDINVFSARVLNMISTKFYGTLIVTKERHGATNNTKVQKGLLHI